MALLIAWLLAACGPVRLPDFLPLELPGASPTPGTPAVQARSTRPPDTPPATLPALVTPTLRTVMPGRRVTLTPVPGSTGQAPGPSPTSPPQTAAEVLYLADFEGRLAGWNPGNDAMRLLAYRVHSYMPAPNGGQVAVLRTSGVDPGQGDRYDLVMLDPRTLRTTVLLERTPLVYNLAISPRGDWLAYTSLEFGGSIYLAPTSGESRPRRVAECDREPERICASLPVWSADGARLAWSDAQGLWLISPGEDEPILGLSSTLRVTDPGGGTSEVHVRFGDLSWSPQGRYLLSRVSPTGSQVSWLGLLDIRLQRQAEIPGTYELEEESARAAWLSDGRLLVGYSGVAGDEPPAVAIWRVVPTRDDLLLQDLRMAIPDRLLPRPGRELPQPVRYQVDWLNPNQELRPAFAVRIPGSEASPTVLSLDLRYHTLEKVNELPYDVLEILWSPVTEGGIVLGSHEQILYLPEWGAPLMDLRPVLGDEARSFSWAPLR